MYNVFYNLKDRPFRLEPDLKYFYTSRPHKRAIIHMQAGFEHPDGVLVLTGDKGLGKTSLITYILNQLDKNKNTIALVQISPNKEQNFLAAVLAALEVSTTEYEPKKLFHILQNYLLEQATLNKKVLLVIDDAENLSQNLLEFIRLLSALPTDKHGLLKIVLVGTIELEEMLSANNNHAFRQHISMSYCMHPLKNTDTREYVAHRLKVAGWNEDPAIDEDIYDAIHQLTEGVPYTINRYCDRLLMLSMLRKSRHITRSDVSNLTLATMEKLEKFEAAQMEGDKKIESDGAVINQPSSLHQQPKITEPPHQTAQPPHAISEFDIENNLDNMLFDAPTKKSKSFFNKQIFITIAAVYLISTVSFFAYNKMTETNSSTADVSHANANDHSNAAHPVANTDSHSNDTHNASNSQEPTYILAEMPASSVQAHLNGDSNIQLLDIKLLLKKGQNLDSEVSSDLSDSNRTNAAAAGNTFDTTQNSGSQFSRSSHNPSEVALH